MMMLMHIMLVSMIIILWQWDEVMVEEEPIHTIIVVITAEMGVPFPDGDKTDYWPKKKRRLDISMRDIGLVIPHNEVIAFSNSSSDQCILNIKFFKQHVFG